MDIHEEHKAEFERNQRWFIEHFETILKKYRDKFVAVWNQSVIEADAGYINAHIISQSLGIDETVEFLVDTGASRTTLLDKDVIIENTFPAGKRRDK